MEVNQRKKAIIVGAGIGGLTAAITLRRAGIEVEVYERAPELRAAGSGLSVMSNAVSALDSLGIDLALEKRGQAVEKFEILTAKGTTMRDMPFKEVTDRLGAPSVCISRSDLQTALLEKAGDTPLETGMAATRFERDGEGVRVHFDGGRQVTGDVLIGADGFNSIIRRQLVGPEEARDSGYICWLGIISFKHPRFTTGYLGHYWGPGQRFGLIDIGHGRLYWWGTKNMPQEQSHNWRGGKADIVRAYAGWADEVQSAIRQTPEEAIIALPSRDRAFLERWGFGPVTLLGDAAHPMLTSLGQGAGMAIEDAVVLAKSLGTAPDLTNGLRQYEDARRDRTREMVANSRIVSDFEQIENPVRCTLRHAYMRFMPRSVLTRRAELALTFPS